MEDPQTSGTVREGGGLENQNESRETEFNVGERQGRSVEQQPVESKIDIGQLAKELRNVTERQDSLLNLLNRSLNIHPSISPVPETTLSEQIPPEELTWTYNVAQRYWASLIPTDENISKTVRLFLGDIVNGSHWLKKASRAQTSDKPKAEVIHESGSAKGGTTVKTTFVFEWDPPPTDPNQSLCRQPSTEIDADTEAVLAS
ncbi:hypothetical protein VMCG_08000 [Cytospora schulzeri]|uniref:Uncharacterized protein n=1 Tax=Cytospora schulzeri TaxID=448051 RepID=A0A423VYB0_9PEZI|nr:hypothetical protein VMCG_08000 [Valsa malicola]